MKPVPNAQWKMINDPINCPEKCSGRNIKTEHFLAGDGRPIAESGLVQSCRAAPRVMECVMPRDIAMEGFGKNE